MTVSDIETKMGVSLNSFWETKRSYAEAHLDLSYFESNFPCKASLISFCGIMNMKLQALGDKAQKEKK